MIKNSEMYQARRGGTLETLETSEEAQRASLGENIIGENIKRSETLGQLIRRRMYDLRIDSVAELARRTGYSKSYLLHLANDTAPVKRGHYLPAPEMVRKLAHILAVSETEILKAIGYLF